MNMDTHLRLLNDLRIEFVLAARDRKDVELVAFHADLDLRRVAGASPPVYIPDAVVELAIGSQDVVLMIEVDTGTEGLSAFKTKVVNTVALWQGNRKCWGALPGTWRPVVFVPAGTRAKALARTIVEAGGGELWLISEFERLRVNGALGAIFARAEAVARTPRGEPVSYDGALAPALSAGESKEPSR
jgi:hypothetical protein